ncbi:MAG TPA: hypothetical protein DIV86_07700 [Alphaproteobacteria bacterium]|nr:hypothetical protein [Alphaproteobacteria bacterium]
MKLSIKIPLLIIIFAFLTAAGVSYVSYKSTAEKLNEQNRGSLFAMMENKSNELTQYLNSLEKDLHFFADLNSTKEALIKFNKAFKKIENSPKEVLQKLYITENSNPLGQKHKLDYATDGSKYSELHKKNHPWIRKFLEEKGYYDVFLINLEGDVVYTVFKELDYATNLNSGEWKDSDLGNAFRAALKGGDEDVHFFDFKPYAPSANAPASFISKQIVGDDGEVMGVLVFQMPVDNLNAIFSSTSGLGETGEICLYGADYLMRNNSRFSKEGETSILQRKWEVDHIDESVNEGEADYQVGPNYDGKEVMLAHAPFEWKGTKYAMITTQAIEEFEKPLYELKEQVIRDTVIALMICGVLGFIISYPTSRRIRALASSVTEISKGIDTQVAGINAKDELGEIARNLTQINDIGKASLRVKSALDNTSTGMMMSDNDLNIIYMNKAVDKLLKDSESEIKKSLPQFNANELMGKKIDFFHKNPSHQHNVLAKMGDEHKGTINLGAKIFDLTINRVKNVKNENIGFAVQWADVTEKRNQEKAEAKMQEEIAEIVTAASQGDFTRKLETSGRSGFFLKLCEGMNTINEVSNRGLSEINNVVQALSNGDLTRTIKGDYEGMFAEIKESVNNTIHKLKQITSEIKDAARSVSGSAGEISSASGDLSRRTESQASTLEETAASMEQITGAVTQNTKNARDANQFASEATSIAQEGGEVVKKVVGAMGKITESSTKIADIISVIDEIAFQTNLLALNAAVEAARAGDAGKGFAVVADEVRSLAGRSAQASKEIKGLIQQSVTQVKDGSTLVDKAGATLEQVVTSFNKLAGLISDISNASEEQSTGINEINSAVSQMDATTQENAAMVEENTAAAETLTQLASDLMSLVNFFKSDDEGSSYYESKPLKKVSGRESKKISSHSDPKPVLKSKQKTTQVATSEGWEEF